MLQNIEDIFRDNTKKKKNRRQGFNFWNFFTTAKEWTTSSWSIRTFLADLTTLAPEVENRWIALCDPSEKRLQIRPVTTYEYYYKLMSKCCVFFCFWESSAICIENWRPRKTLQIAALQKLWLFGNITNDIFILETTAITTVTDKITNVYFSCLGYLVVLIRIVVKKEFPDRKPSSFVEEEINIFP